MKSPDYQSSSPAQMEATKVAPTCIPNTRQRALQLLAPAILGTSLVAQTARAQDSAEGNVEGSAEISTDGATTTSTSSSSTGKMESVFGPGGFFFHLEGNYSYFNKGDDMFGTRLSGGYKLPFGLKAGFDSSPYLMRASSVCKSQPTKAACDACFDRGDDQNPFYGLGPMVGFDLMASERTGFEVTGHWTWGLLGVSGSSLHGGVIIFHRLAEPSVPVSLRAGLEYGYSSYNVRGVDISKSTIVPVVGLGWQL